MIVFLRKMPPLNLAMLLFLSGAVLAAISAYDWRLCLPFLLALAVGIGLYAGLVLWVRTARRLSLASAGLVLLACGYAFIFVIQYRHLGWNAKLDLFTRLGLFLSAPFPSLLHPGLTANAAAALLEGCVPLALGLAFDGRGWRRGLWIAAACLLIFVILLSASRGAWLALLITGLIGTVGFIWQRQLAIPRVRIQVGARPPLAFYANRVSRRVMLLLLPLMIIAIGLRSLAPLLSSALLMRAIDRLALYRDSFYLALEFPFTGIGGGAVFAMVYSHFQLLIQVPYLEYAHNLWLCVWLAHGLLGLLGFLGLILVSIRLVWRALPQLSGAGFGAALGGLSLLLHGFTDAPQYDSKWPVLYMAFALFGLLVSAAWLVNNQPLRWIRLARSDIYLQSHSGSYGLQRWSALRMILVVLTLSIALVIFSPGLAALAASNAAAVMHAHAHLAPGLSDIERTQTLARADAWLDRGQQLMPRSAAILREHGILAFERGKYAETIWLLKRAAAAYPDDQGLLKSLGLACTWYGYTNEGAQILAGLTHADELPDELGVWAVAWEQRGEDQYAANSRVVAERLQR